MATSLDTERLSPDSSSPIDDENYESESLLEQEPCEGTTKTSFVRKLFELVFHEPDDVVGFLDDGSSFEVKSCLTEQGRL